MATEQIDGALQELRDATTAIRENLLDVELDPNRELLDAAALRGVSATSWSEASAAFGRLWRWHELLAVLLGRAEQLRGTRARPPAKRLDELTELLQGPSIELSEEPLPLEQRHLLAGPQRLSARDLLERCAATFDDAKAVLVAAARSWDEYEPRLQSVRAALEESTALARALGEAEPGELARARTGLEQLSGRLTSDPLSVSAADVRELEDSSASVRADLEGLERLRRELDGRLSEARGLLEELRCAERDGRVAHKQALAKIAAPEVPEPLRAVEALERQLDDVADVARHRAWREARTLLEQWSSRAREQLEQARSIAQANYGPIRARDELRGRLDAYQAKAAHYGLIEDSRVCRDYERARECLFTAPTDLARAGELVEHYRRGLAEVGPPGEARQ
jgi:hypothetical protein